MKRKHLRKHIFCIVFCLASSVAVVGGRTQRMTEAGVPLESPWKQTIYDFAKTNLKHPAWGWSHSERDYKLALEIAGSENLKIDKDVLFAAAFLHDIGAIEPFSREGVDHSARSTEVSEEILRKAGFPMDKFPAVKDAILGHMYDVVPTNRAEAVVLHDADTLDFMGTIGVARMLAVTGKSPDFRRAINTIESFQKELPSKLITKTARKMSVQRIAEMKRFLQTLETQTYGKKVL
jgi:uncharacterized protein